MPRPIHPAFLGNSAAAVAMRARIQPTGTATRTGTGQARGAGVATKEKRTVLWLLLGIAVSVIVLGVCLAAFLPSEMCYRVNSNYCFSLHYKPVLVPHRQRDFTVRLEANCSHPIVISPLWEVFYYVTWTDMPVEKGPLQSCYGLHGRVRNDTVEFVRFVTDSRNLLGIFTTLGVGLYTRKMSKGARHTLFTNIVAFFFISIPFWLDLILNNPLSRPVFHSFAKQFGVADISGADAEVKGTFISLQLLANSSVPLHTFAEHLISHLTSKNQHVKPQHIRAMFFGGIRLFYYLCVLMDSIPRAAAHMHKKNIGLECLLPWLAYMGFLVYGIGNIENWHGAMSFFGGLFGSSGHGLYNARAMWIESNGRLVPVDNTMMLRSNGLSVPAQRTNVQRSTASTDIELSYIRRQLYVYACFVYFDIMCVINIDLAEFDYLYVYDELEFLHVLWFVVLYGVTMPFQKCRASKRIVLLCNLMVFAMVNLHLTVHALGPESIGNGSIRASNRNK
jgi:hypothetical protein